MGEVGADPVGGNGFYRWDTDSNDSAESESVPPGRYPIMARVPGDVLRDSGFFSGPT